MEALRQSFSITFFLRPKTKDSNSGLIYMNIGLLGKRVKISTKQECPIISWNSKAHRVTPISAIERSVNEELDNLEVKVKNSFNKLYYTGGIFTVHDIKNVVMGIRTNERSVMDLFDYHSSHFEDQLAIGTLKHYNTTQEYFKCFIKHHYKVPDLDISQLNMDFLHSFEHYIHTVNKTKLQQQCGNNTLMKHIKRLRKLINMAVRNEWIEKDPFANFKYSYTKSNREFLTQEDLTKIEEKELSITRLQHVKDLFVFSCYTGLSYSDVIQLSPENIQRSIDGDFWIKTHRTKTEIPVTLPILPKALDILMKYQNHPEVMRDNKIFPSISNQKLNTYLKEIAIICNISHLLTFHVARHTFATTITLTNGVPIETVSKMLGHTSIKTTQIYAKVIDKKIGNDMRNLKSLLMNNTNKQASGF